MWGMDVQNMTLKDQIRLQLEQHRGVSLSGQELAGQFGVSRSAVWKAINALKREGYSIESSTNRGYRLAEGCARLAAELIQTELEDTSLPVYVLSSTDSTNEEARRRLTQQKGCCFVVAAEEQTAGRGRRGRSFYSPKDTGLYLTLATSPETSMDRMMGITAYAAVCTARAIRDLCGKQPQIKWVNDLFLDGRKIGGILTEAVFDFETGRVSHLMIGVGLNLHPCNVPPELRKTMGFLETGGGMKNRLAAAIVNALLKYDEGDTGYMQDYRRWSMVLGQEIVYEKEGKKWIGSAVSIRDDGGLEVQQSDGSTVVLRSGEITLRLKS